MTNQEVKQQQELLQTALLQQQQQRALESVPTSGNLNNQASNQPSIRNRPWFVKSDLPLPPQGPTPGGLPAPSPVNESSTALTPKELDRLERKQRLKSTLKLLLGGQRQRAPSRPAQRDVDSKDLASSGHGHHQRNSDSRAQGPRQGHYPGDADSTFLASSRVYHQRDADLEGPGTRQGHSHRADDSRGSGDHQRDADSKGYNQGYYRRDAYIEGPGTRQGDQERAADSRGHGYRQKDADNTRHYQKDAYIEGPGTRQGDHERAAVSKVLAPGHRYNQRDPVSRVLASRGRGYSHDGVPRPRPPATKSRDDVRTSNPARAGVRRDQDKQGRLPEPTSKQEYVSPGASFPASGLEALEDEVGRIVRADAESVADKEMSSRMTQIEQGLSRLFGLLENQVIHRLDRQDHSNRAQALKQGAGAARHDVETGDATTTGLSQGPVSNARALTEPGPTLAVQEPAASFGANSLTELHMVMQALHRIEQKEEELRRKWFVGSHPSSRAVPPPLMVRDGQVTLNTTTSAPLEAGTISQAVQKEEGGRSKPEAASPVPSAPSTITEAAPKNVGYPSVKEATPLAGGGGGGTPSGGGRGSGGTPSAGGGGGGGTPSAGGSAPRPEPVSDSFLSNVMSKVKLFIGLQRKRDGELVASSDPRLNPVDVVEDIADRLVEELLEEHAKELLSLCDELGDQLFESEFQDA
eukprot:gene3436-13492_t